MAHTELGAALLRDGARERSTARSARERRSRRAITRRCDAAAARRSSR